jgi:UDPglucose 6-dehydrogenase
MMYKICEKMGLNFDNVRDMILSDGRIARSHANVPGWDGKLGYSGSCFPKDINALIHFVNKLGLNAGLLEASWAQNLEDRPEKDWEHIPSAVSKKETK